MSAVHQYVFGEVDAAVGGDEVEAGEHGGQCAHQVAAGGVDDSLGFTGGAAGVEQEQRVFGGHGAVAVRGGLGVNNVVPPEVAAVLHGGVLAGAFHDQHGFHLQVAVFVVGGGAEGVVDDGFEGEGFAAAELAVGGDDDAGAGVDEALAEGGCAEAAEDDGVDDAEAGAGQHGDDGFGDAGQVDGGAVAGAEAEGGQVVGGFADVVEEFLVGDVTGVVGVFADPVVGDDVSAAGVDVAVEAVGCGVDGAAVEPAGAGCVAPVEDGGPGGVPVKVLGGSFPVFDDVVIDGDDVGVEAGDGGGRV